MNKILKRTISIMLSGTMACSIFPFHIFADSNTETDIGTLLDSVSGFMPVEETVSNINEGYNTGISNVSFAYSSLQGSVVDKNGAGIAGAAVCIFNVDEGEILALCSTDANGKWDSLSYEIVEGYSYRIRYYKAGYNFNQNDILCTAGTNGTVLNPVTAEKAATNPVCDESDYTYVIKEEKAHITKYTGSDAHLFSRKNWADILSH